MKVGLLKIILFSAPGDYAAIVDMVITFPAGQTSVTFPVPTEADSISEVPERFAGILSSPSGGVILGNDFSASIDIVDDNSKSPQQASGWHFKIKVPLLLRKASTYVYQHFFVLQSSIKNH